MTSVPNDREELAETLAAAVLALGYRKPRTITTTEELDTLPEGSVVLTCFGDACQMRGTREDLTAWHFLVKYGPATVIHEPEATK